MHRLWEVVGHTPSQSKMHDTFFVKIHDPGNYFGMICCGARCPLIPFLMRSLNKGKARISGIIYPFFQIIGDPGSDRVPFSLHIPQIVYSYRSGLALQYITRRFLKSSFKSLRILFVHTT